MPRRPAFLIAGTLILGLILAATYRIREANCRRMLQTAELARDSYVRSNIWGGCHVVTSSEASAILSPDEASRN